VKSSYWSALMWFGAIFIQHGLYQDGMFKFTLLSLITIQMVTIHSWCLIFLSFTH
jgi:hypothetical protein